MSRRILCEASEKGVIVVNECLNRGIQINTIKLEQLLILMHGRMLSLYNKSFFSQEVVARTHALMIDNVDKDFRIYAIEFKEKLPEYICLLEKEEEVMNYIIERYGNLDFFELKELPVLKKLKDLFSKEDQSNIIPNVKIEKMFNFVMGNKQTFDVMAVPCDRAFVVSPDKTEVFLCVKPNPEIRQQQKEMAETFRRNNLVEEGPVLKKTRKPNKK